MGVWQKVPQGHDNKEEEVRVKIHPAREVQAQEGTVQDLQGTDKIQEEIPGQMTKRATQGGMLDMLKRQGAIIRGVEQVMGVVRTKMGVVVVTEIKEIYPEVRIQAKEGQQVDLQVREEVPETVKALERVDTVGVEMEEIIEGIMETIEVEEIGETMEATEVEEIMETMEVEEMKAMEEMGVMEGIGIIEAEVEVRDTLESMVQAKIPTVQDYMVKITWMTIALLKESMEIFHPNMANMEVNQASMGTALVESMEGTEVTTQPPREVTNQPPREVTILPLKGATIPPQEEATIQPQYEATTQPPRNHSEVMEITEATRQRGVTTQRQ